MRENKSDTLHLFLKGKWYDMIASGEKKEEYRECKPYWDKRLRDVIYGKDGKILVRPIAFRKYIVFHRGYSSETMKFECRNPILIGKGKPEWGAPKDKEVFVIKLGRRLA